MIFFFFCYFTIVVKKKYHLIKINQFIKSGGQGYNLNYFELLIFLIYLKHAWND